MAEATAGRTCGACCTKVIDLGVRFGSTLALEHVNLHMHCGELTALIGPNGAGKTTLLKTLLGELPHTGVIQFLPQGRRPAKAPCVGYVPQKLEVDALAPVTVYDLFAVALGRWPLWLGHGARVRQEAVGALSMVGAGELLDRRVGELSGGQLQRVLLALALTPVPEILLLDEPVAGIDPAGIGLFYQMISGLRQKYDLCVLMISHDLEAVARVADRMVFLNRTILAEGTPADVLKLDLVRRTFGLLTVPADLPTPPARLAHGTEAGVSSP